MVTYDDLDVLAIMWMAGMFIIFGLVALIVHLTPNAPKLPEPQSRAVVGHARWYRVTTSRINDRKGI